MGSSYWRMGSADVAKLGSTGNCGIPHLQRASIRKVSFIKGLEIKKFIYHCGIR